MMRSREDMIDQAVRERTSAGERRGINWSGSGEPWRISHAEGMWPDAVKSIRTRFQQIAAINGMRASHNQRDAGAYCGLGGE